jgi:anti-sigma B factor antagonist
VNHSLTTNLRRDGDFAIIDLTGEINAFADQELNDVYTQAETYGTSTIVLNFRNISYINSTGIALIVGLLSRARKSGRQLAVFGLSEHFREIFQITRLSDFISVYPDEASLMAEIRP